MSRETRMTRDITQSPAYLAGVEAAEAEDAPVSDEQARKAAASLGQRLRKDAAEQAGQSPDRRSAAA